MNCSTNTFSIKNTFFSNRTIALWLNIKPRCRGLYLGRTFFLFNDFRCSSRPLVSEDSSKINVLTVHRSQKFPVNNLEINLSGMQNYGVIPLVESFCCFFYNFSFYGNRNQFDPPINSKRSEATRLKHSNNYS